MVYIFLKEIMVSMKIDVILENILKVICMIWKGFGLVDNDVLGGDM